MRGVEAGGRDVLPEHGVAQSADPEPGEELEVLEPLAMSAERDLVAVPIAQAGDCALQSRPELERGR